MTPKDIYKSFQLKVNKNSTNNNIAVPIGVFVTLWNEQKRQWLDEKVKGKEDSNYIDDLEELLEVDVKLNSVKTFSNKDDFSLPSNFFRRVASYSIADKGDCKGKRITNWFAKPKDLEVLLLNSNYDPNFEWEESLAVLNKGKLSVYKKDFKIKNTYLTYYREPVDLDIEGWIHIDGTPSKDVMVDLDDLNIEEITNRTVVDVVSNYESGEQAQMAAARVQRNESIKQ